MAARSWWRCRDLSLPLGERTLVMGILNLTPDSFSDGGLYLDPEMAVAHARQMLGAGAEVIDVGAESTRPGAQPVSAADQLARLGPLLARLDEVAGAVWSIDTSQPEVAEAALAHGFHVVNDVWGLQRHPDLAAVVGRQRAGVVLMHNRLHEGQGDLAAEIVTFLERSQEIAEESGIAPEQILVDPGIGFGKNAQESVAALRLIPQLVRHDWRVLVGVSRKRVLGHLTGRSVEDRAQATAVASALAVALGADAVRVHDVAEVTEAVRVADAMVR